MKPRILFVEDDEFIRKIYSDRFNASDFDIVSAQSVASAKSAFAGHEFDIVCLDHILPDGTGLDILNWIRGEKKSNIPVVIFSASGQEAGIKEFMEAGATEFIQKDHVKPTELIQKLKEIIEKQKHA